MRRARGGSPGSTSSPSPARPPSTTCSRPRTPASIGSSPTTSVSSCSAGGRSSSSTATLTRWLLALDDVDVLAGQLDVAIMGANLFGLHGHRRLAERWANAAANGAGGVTLPDGSSGEGWIAGVRAALCLDGAET